MTPPDYALHNVTTGKMDDLTKRKRWWMEKLAGPQRRKYARMLMGLPPVRSTTNE